MKDHTTAIERFFADHARRFNEAIQQPPVVDVEGLQKSFADYFVEASPAGVHGGKNGLLLRMMIPRGFAHYRKIGTTAMKVASLTVTSIDDMHVMARVGWDSRYRKNGREIAIAFENVYLLQITASGPKIFAYITGDERKVLAEHGLG